MAWIGIRPLATSCPPERRSATANGAAQRFSHTSTPATVPGSSAVGGLLEVVRTEQAGRGALELREPFPIGELGEVERAHGAVLALGQEREVEDADQAAIDQVQQQRHDLARDRLVAVPLEHHIVDRSQLFDHDVSFRCHACAAIAVAGIVSPSSSPATNWAEARISIASRLPMCPRVHRPRASRASPRTGDLARRGRPFRPGRRLVRGRA